jgi:hypothetical protein
MPAAVSLSGSASNVLGRLQGALQEAARMDRGRARRISDPATQGALLSAVALQEQIAAEIADWPSSASGVEARLAELETRGGAWDSLPYGSEARERALAARKAAAVLRYVLAEVVVPPDAEFDLATPLGEVRIEVRGRDVEAWSGSERVGRLQVEYLDEDRRHRQLFLATVQIDEAWQRQGLATAMAFAVLRLYPGHRLGLTPRDCGNSEAGDDWSDAIRERYPYAAGLSSDPSADGPDPLASATRAVVRTLHAAESVLGEMGTAPVVPLLSPTSAPRVAAPTVAQAASATSAPFVASVAARPADAERTRTAARAR